jgi:hypothetical protein
MNVLRWMAWTVAAIVVAGCVPELYTWSPDGKWVTVISDKQGLRVADSTGKLLPQAVPDANSAAWFADSQRLLVSRNITVASWDEYSKYLTPQQLSAVTDGAQRAMTAILAYDWSVAAGNSWDKFKTAFIGEESKAGRDTKVYTDFAGGIGLNLRDQGGAALQNKLPPERWDELTKGTVTMGIVEVCTLDADGPVEGERCFVSPEKGLLSLRIAPGGAAAVVVVPGEKDVSSLWLIQTAAGRPTTLLSDAAAMFPDWSADGRDVCFIRKSGGARPFGTLSRVHVIGDDGRVLDNLADPEDLAGLLFDQMCRVRCLKDGRIVFVNAEVTLPATPNDYPQSPELFSVAPGQEATVSRVLPRSTVNQMGDASEFFEISPDGSKASIPFADGRVTVVDLATGAVSNVQPQTISSASQSHFSLPSVPTWRSNDELTFVAPSANGTLNVVLWSISKNAGRVLSEDWPDEVSPGATTRADK